MIFAVPRYGFHGINLRVSYSTGGLGQKSFVLVRSDHVPSTTKSQTTQKQHVADD